MSSPKSTVLPTSTHGNKGINKPEELISIIMPARDASLYLDECMESIIGQSYNNWELIAINDHSEDETFDILTNYSRSDARITVANNKGKGIIDALKTAFSLSDGSYIHRMDSDDIMPPDKLLLLLEGFNEGDFHVATGEVKYFGDELKEGYIKYEQWLNSIKQEEFWQDVFLECVLPSPCWLMRRSLFGEYINDPDLCYPEDYYLSFFLADKQAKVIKINQCLHLWRDHSTRASRNDINYEEQSFLPLKTLFFKRMALDLNRELLLWGAGKKGKKIAKSLIEHDISFRWISNNINKINHNIYGIIVESTEKIIFNPIQHQVIIGFSGPEDKKLAEQLLIEKSMKKAEDYFSFY